MNSHLKTVIMKKKSNNNNKLGEVVVVLHMYREISFFSFFKQPEWIILVGIGLA